MFSTTNSIGGEIADIVTYLEQVYRQQKNQPNGVTLACDDFLQFAKSHLNDVRPSELFVMDNNYGILLTNGQRIKICPDFVAVRKGDMANPESAISINRRD